MTFATALSIQAETVFNEFDFDRASACEKTDKTGPVLSMDELRHYAREALTSAAEGGEGGVGPFQARRIIGADEDGKWAKLVLEYIPITADTHDATGYSD